jgi:hypothetical protein
MLRFRGVGLGVVVAVGVVAVAGASHNGAAHVDHYVGADGWGELIANPGGHPVTWERCAPECAPIDDGDAEPQWLKVVDQPAGARFVATQDGVSASSEVWRGRLHATAPPVLEGEARVGALVRPLAAQWEGGWGREADWLQLQSCRTREGEGCVVLVDRIKFGDCEPGGARYVPETALGRWLQVVDVRIDRDQPFSLEGYERPEGIRPNRPTGPGFAVATFGPVQEGAPREGKCPGGVKPEIQYLPSPYLPFAILARVRCPLGCSVAWTIRQGRRSVSGRRRLGEEQATLVEIPRRSARRFRPGRATVRLRIDGRLHRARTVRLRATSSSG